jgi:hypothetical protein
MQNHAIAQSRRCSLIGAAAMAMALALPLTATAQVLGPPAASPAPGIATLPGPSIDTAKALAPLGLTPRGEVYRAKKHHQIAATTREGRGVIVAFDWAGRVKSITDASHRKGGVYGATMPAQAQLEASARAAGFEPLGIVETKRHHVVMRARNQQSEMLDLHIDFAGAIYKQVWLR